MYVIMKVTNKMQLHRLMLQLLYNSERTPVATKYEAPWMVWTFWRREISPVPAGVSTLDRPTCSLNTILTTLSQILIWRVAVNTLSD
jgi:hypothetical protein